MKVVFAVVRDSTRGNGLLRKNTDKTLHATTTWELIKLAWNNWAEPRVCAVHISILSDLFQRGNKQTNKKKTPNESNFGAQWESTNPLNNPPAEKVGICNI